MISIPRQIQAKNDKGEASQGCSHLWSFRCPCLPHGEYSRCTVYQKSSISDALKLVGFDRAQNTEQVDRYTIQIGNCFAWGKDKQEWTTGNSNKKNVFHKPLHCKLSQGREQKQATPNIQSHWVRTHSGPRTVRILHFCNWPLILLLASSLVRSAMLHFHAPVHYWQQESIKIMTFENWNNAWQLCKLNYFQWDGLAGQLMCSNSCNNNLWNEYRHNWKA